jgi:hypothetical protein
MKRTIYNARFLFREIAECNYLTELNVDVNIIDDNWQVKAVTESSKTFCKKMNMKVSHNLLFNQLKGSLIWLLYFTPLYCEWKVALSSFT